MVKSGLYQWKKKVLKNILYPEGHFLKDFGIEGDAHAGKWHRQGKPFIL